MNQTEYHPRVIAFRRRYGYAPYNHSQQECHVVGKNELDSRGSLPADSPPGIGAMVYVPREVQEYWRQKERNRRSKFNKILQL